MRTSADDHDPSCLTVDGPDFCDFRIGVGAEELDLAVSVYSDFERNLDFRTGLLTRSFIWELKYGGKIELSFERLLSMEYPGLSAQRVRFVSRGFAGTIRIGSGVDFGDPPESTGQSRGNYQTGWCLDARERGSTAGLSAAITAHTVSTRQYVSVAFDLRCPEQELIARYRATDFYAGYDCTVKLDYHKSICIEKRSLILKHDMLERPPTSPVAVLTRRKSRRKAARPESATTRASDLTSQSLSALTNHAIAGFQSALDSNFLYWSSMRAAPPGVSVQK